jgi:hypothetical protein
MKYYDAYKMTVRHEIKSGNMTVERLDEGAVTDAVKNFVLSMAKWVRDVLVGIFGKNAEKIAAEVEKTLADDKLTPEDKRVKIYNDYAAMVNTSMPETLIKKYRQDAKPTEKPTEKPVAKDKDAEKSKSENQPAAPASTSTPTPAANTPKPFIRSPTTSNTPLIPPKAGNISAPPPPRQPEVKKESVYAKMFRDILYEADEKDVKADMNALDQSIPNWLKGMPGNIVGPVKKMKDNMIEVKIKEMPEDSLCLEKVGDAVYASVLSQGKSVSSNIFYAPSNANFKDIIGLFDTAAATADTAKTAKTAPSSTVVKTSELPYAPVYVNLIPIKREDLNDKSNTIQAKFKIVGYASQVQKDGTYAIYSTPDLAKLPDKVENIIKYTFQDITAQTKDKASGMPLITFTPGGVNTQADTEQIVNVKFSDKLMKKKELAMSFSVADFKTYPEEFNKTVKRLESSPVLKVGGAGFMIPTSDPKAEYDVRRFTGVSSYPLYLYVALKRVQELRGQYQDKFNGSNTGFYYDTAFNSKDATFRSAPSIQAFINKMNEELSKLSDEKGRISITSFDVVGESQDDGGKFKWVMINPRWNVGEGEPAAEKVKTGPAPAPAKTGADYATLAANSTVKTRPQDVSPAKAYK